MGRVAVDGRVKVKWGLNKCDDVKWTDLAQAGDTCRAAVNTVVHLRFPSNVGNFLTG
jgi:hypothetical protein